MGGIINYLMKGFIAIVSRNQNHSYNEVMNSTKHIDCSHKSMGYSIRKFDIQKTHKAIALDNCIFY